MLSPDVHRRHSSVLPTRILRCRRRPSTAPSPAGQVPIASHIDELWNTLTRSTTSAPAFCLAVAAAGPPYVVPGGRFREIYYWGFVFSRCSVWIRAGGHDLVQDMVRDFAYLIDRYDHVPNGTRSYYLSRSSAAVLLRDGRAAVS